MQDYIINSVAAQGQHARNARCGGRPRAHGLVGLDFHEVILVNRAFQRYLSGYGFFLCGLRSTPSTLNPKPV